MLLTNELTFANWLKIIFASSVLGRIPLRLTVTLKVFQYSPPWIKHETNCFTVVRFYSDGLVVAMVT